MDDYTSVKTVFWSGFNYMNGICLIFVENPEARTLLKFWWFSEGPLPNHVKKLETPVSAVNTLAQDQFKSNGPFGNRFIDVSVTYRKPNHRLGVLLIGPKNPWILGSLHFRLGWRTVNLKTLYWATTQSFFSGFAVHYKTCPKQPTVSRKSTIHCEKRQKKADSCGSTTQEKRGFQDLHIFFIWKVIKEPPLHSLFEAVSYNVHFR